MKASQILFIIALLTLTNSVNAQVVSVAEALQSKDAATFIHLKNDKTELKKFYRNLSKFENLQGVLFDASFDSISLEQVLVKLNKSETLLEIFVSVGQRNALPVSLTEMSQIQVLKIFNSPNVSARSLAEITRGMSGLRKLSWIDNGSTFPEIDLGNVSEIEWIDTAFPFKRSYWNYFSKAKFLEGLTLGINDLDSLPFITGNIPENLYLVNFNQCPNWDKDQFLLLGDELAEELTITPANINYDVNISYYAEEQELSDDDKDKISSMFTVAEGKTIPDRKDISIIPESIEFESTVFHKNRFVNPPIEALTLPEKLYSVSAESGRNLSTESGTIIEIPEDAFIDKDGRSVRGEVTISYREFRNPIDFLLSGIPMTYDSGGVVNQFQSAGMFEIYASQNNKELSLKPGKTIAMKFASTDTSDAFNFYRYSEQDSNWNYESVANRAPVNSGSVPQPVSNTRALPDSIFESYYYIDSSNLNNIDTTSFSKRYSSIEYHYLGNRNKSRDTIQYFKSQYNRITGRYTYHSVNRLTNHIIVKPSKKILKVTVLTKEKGDSFNHARIVFKDYNTLRAFPELTCFRNYVFVVKGFSKNREFREKYITDKVYGDIRILYNPGEPTGTLELKTKEGFTHIEFELSNPYNRHNSRGVIVNFNRRHRNYRKLLEKREKAFNNSNVVKIERTLRNSRKRGMVKVAFDSTRHYAAFIRNQTSAAFFYDNEIVRNLSISGLGIYNIDQIARLRNPVTMSVVFLDSSGAAVDEQSYRVLVVDQSINGVLTYSSKDVTLQPKNTDAVIVVALAGTSSVIYYALKDNIPKKGDAPILLRRNDLTINNRQDFFKIFGLK